MRKINAAPTYFPTSILLLKIFFRGTQTQQVYDSDIFPTTNTNTDAFRNLKSQEYKRNHYLCREQVKKLRENRSALK